MSKSAPATIALVIVGILAPAPMAAGQTRPPIAEQIAKTYGLDAYGQIEAIRYTFYLELPGVNINRAWIWEPKTGQVSYESKDREGKPIKVTYFRSRLDAEPASVRDEIDPAFTNDEYNLLFPLHVYWDTTADVQDLGMQKLPIADGTAKRVVVKYPAEGGYTPGDTWELYLGSDGRVGEFVYHRGGATKPSLVTATWQGYKKAGPLLVSTERRGTADDKPVRWGFSDVAVKMTGSATWIEAQ